MDYAEIVSSHMGSDEINEKFERIKKKYAEELTVFEWARRDDNGIICYFQGDAIKDFIYRFREQFDYGIVIDIDEFLISDKTFLVSDLITYMETRNISSAFLAQKRFLYRYASLDTTVREIPYCLKEDVETPDTRACKTMFRMSLFHAFDEQVVVHYIRTVLLNKHIDPNVMRLNHYQWPAFRGKHSLGELSDDERRFLCERFAEDRSAFKYLSSRSIEKSTVSAGALSLSTSTH